MAIRFVLPFADVGSGILPSSGAKLFFYENKTVGTDKDTFTSPDAGTPNSNPVISDANGLFPDIFIDGVYTVVLKDKNDVQKWEVDDVNNFSDELTVTKSGLTVVEGQLIYQLPSNVSVNSVVVINGRVQHETAGAYFINADNDLVLSEALFAGDLLEIWTRAVTASVDLGTKANPITFDSIRDLLNTDLTSTNFPINGWIETLGRAKKNDGGGATFKIAASGTVDYETIIPLKLGLVGELVNGTRLIRHNGEIEIIAHRGFSLFNVEGTMYAWSAALRYGATSLECDIQFTSDGFMVLYHDKDTMTNDMNGITGRVKDNTLAQVQAATFKQLAGNILENKVVIPEFSELAVLTQKAGCLLHAEIKAYRTQADIDDIVQLIVDMGLEQCITLHSFILSDIQYVRNINKNIKVAYLMTSFTANDPEGATPDQAFDFLRRDKNAIINASIGAIDNPPVAPNPFTASLQAEGIEVVAWGVDDSQGVNFARRNNVNGIVTDLPYALLTNVRIKHGTII